MTQVSETTEQLPEFFAIVQPGLELLAVNEVFNYLPELEVEADRGGFTFHAPLEVGCEMNRWLKIPTRLLLRLNSFTCRDFPKLFKKTANFSWDDWIPSNAEVEFQASSHASRLFVKKRIEETCAEGFEKWKKENRKQRQVSAETEVDEVERVQVFVRLNDDICTFSLDTSGEILHKRGTRQLTSDAPIRETLAAALLFWMMARDDDANAERGTAGVADFVASTRKPVTLVDPMMGSGTFFLEAVLLNQKIEQRNFAFEKFPKFSKSEVPHLTFTPELTVPFKKYIGLELDEKAIRTTLGNLKPFMRTGFEVEARQGDIFKAEPLAKLENERRWLIANPPYGERLKVEGPLKEYYESLFEACERFAAPERACFVLPETARPLKLRVPRGWKLDDSIRFQNGGIPVTAVQYIRES